MRVADTADVFPLTAGVDVPLAGVDAPLAGVDVPLAGAYTFPTMSVGQSLSPTLVAALLFPVVTLLTLGSWIYLDARARDSDHPVRWAIEVALVPPLVLAYVRYRGERTRPQSDRERLALTLLLALLMAMMAGTVLSPPDVFAAPRDTFGAFLVLLPLFYWLIYRDRDPDRQTRTEEGTESDSADGAATDPEDETD